MRLGEIAWKIDFTSDEKERISLLLSDEKHVSRKILLRYAEKSQLFSPIAKSLQKKVKGFRTKSREYKKRALNIVLDELQNNKAPQPFWILYKESVVQYIQDQMPNFDQLMDTIEIETTNSEIDLISHKLIETICENARDFNVHDENVRQIYELWPFERNDNFEQLTRKCPKFDRFKAIEASIENLKSSTERIESDLLESLTEYVDDKVGKDSKVNYEELISKYIQDAASKIEEELINKFSDMELKFDALKERLSDLGEDFENRMDGHKDEMGNIASQVDTRILEMESKADKLLENIKSTEIQNRTEDLLPVLGGDFSAPHRGVYENLQFRIPDHDEKVISETDFISKYHNCLERNGIYCSDLYVQILHTLFKANTVISVSDSGIVDSWFESLGWVNNIFRIAASPAWSEPSDWSEGTDHLLRAESEKPKVLYIYDYETGFVDGYLNPVLKVWSESGYRNPFEKLVLIRNRVNKDDSDSDLKAPSLWPNYLWDQDVHSTAALPENNSVSDGEENNKYKISAECYISWIRQTELSKDANHEDIHISPYEILMAMVDDLGITRSEPLFAILRNISTSLLQMGLDVKVVIKICVRTILLPWVSANCGEDLAEELKVNVDSWLR